jgi:5-methylcytosine-specific restriction endonuclease McrA
VPSDWKPEKRVRDHDMLKRFHIEHVGEPCMVCEARVGTVAHHRTFRSQGGDDVEENLVWVCRICHDNAHGIRSYL